MQPKFAHFWASPGTTGDMSKTSSTIAGLLHALTRKDAVFHWSPECQQAFDRLKTLLTTSPITAFPDFNLGYPSGCTPMP